MFVRDIVGKLEFVEGHNFLHPLLASRGRVWMNVHPFWHFRIRFPSDHPPRVMEFVATVVDGYYIH